MSYKNLYLTDSDWENVNFSHKAPTKRLFLSNCTPVRTTPPAAIIKDALLQDTPCSMFRLHQLLNLCKALTNYEKKDCYIWSAYILEVYASLYNAVFLHTYMNH